MPVFYSLQTRTTCTEAESFCTCKQLENEQSSTASARLNCSCGEELNVHEWVWDNAIISVSTRLLMNDREVQFHPVYSNGTAAVRGNMPCVNNNDYYWEIKMLTPLYGTDGGRGDFSNCTIKLYHVLKKVDVPATLQCFPYTNMILLQKQIDHG
ncbi:hypothetical protein L9F63_005179 [Diploptera punctata]|uniref:Uncharacterized protein n=1 Tax=Diploptera punctata TaxID=6984 RepID=A0AAD7ZE21_DIPPU|nr:hypothetical protein L9F63_005179 [Diploptera punctata]